MSDTKDYGARIERGLVVSSKENGYTVASVSRDGIITPPLPCSGDAVNVGDVVNFFLFDDGKGMIINSGGGKPVEQDYIVLTKTLVLDSAVNAPTVVFSGKEMYDAGITGLSFNWEHYMCDLRAKSLTHTTYQIIRSIMFSDPSQRTESSTDVAFRSGTYHSTSATTTSTAGYYTSTTTAANFCLYINGEGDIVVNANTSYAVGPGVYEATLIVWGRK